MKKRVLFALRRFRLWLGALLLVQILSAVLSRLTVFPRDGGLLVVSVLFYLLLFLCGLSCTRVRWGRRVYLALLGTEAGIAALAILFPWAPLRLVAGGILSYHYVYLKLVGLLEPVGQTISDGWYLLGFLLLSGVFAGVPFFIVKKPTDG